MAVGSWKRDIERAGDRQAARLGRVERSGGADQTSLAPGPSPRRPATASPQALLQLQRTAGNAATVRRLGARQTQTPDAGIVSRPEGPDEREADHVSRKVMERLRAPAAPPLDLPDGGGTARPPGPPLIQRQAKRASGGRTPMTGAIDAARGGGAPLACSIRPQFERAFGVDFADVRIHTDDGSDRLNHSLSALAFTSGRDIFFSRNTYDPGSRRGQALLSHELTHVVQQRLGGTSDSPVIQRLWQDDQQYRKWSDYIQGLQWYHDPATGNYWYYPELNRAVGALEQDVQNLVFAQDGVRRNLNAWALVNGNPPLLNLPPPDVPQAQNNAPQAQNNAPQVQNNAPQVQNNAPQAQNNAPQAQNNAPQAQNNAPQAQNNAPQAQNTPLQLALQVLQNLPTDQEWTLAQLTRALQGGDLQGVCNAMTVAWLSGKITPSKVKMGISSANFHHVYYLKQVLDNVAERSNDFLSYEVTAHFLDYAASLNDDTWFQTLAAQTWRTRAAHFWQWLNGNAERIGDEPENMIGTTTKLPLYERRGVGTFKLQDMATKINRQIIDHAKANEKHCRGYFSLYEGVGETSVGAGHQFAFAYDHQIGVLKIYDQNSETSTQVTTAPGKALATHFKRRYIDVPFHFASGDADRFSLDMFLR